MRVRNWDNFKAATAGKVLYYQTDDGGDTKTITQGYLVSCQVEVGLILEITLKHDSDEARAFESGLKETSIDVS